jgi:nucleoside-diphosphate-sugar epimerase
MNLCADISQLTADTGFVPKTSFSQGVNATVEWIKEVDQHG